MSEPMRYESVEDAGTADQTMQHLIDVLRRSTTDKTISLFVHFGYYENPEDPDSYIGEGYSRLSESVEDAEAFLEDAKAALINTRTSWIRALVRDNLADIWREVMGSLGMEPDEGEKGEDA